MRGYGQHLGYDYLETHLPIIQMELIRAILAITIAKHLKIQQMDVKGAYLNGILKETIYMHQPNSFKNGTTRVCHLIRTLYGLKQSSHKWNAKFNKKMKMWEYKRLRADPYIYIHSEAGKIVIVTIWVDDLLLFTDSEETMEEIKKDIHAKWETTDMGKPTKIVRIEITQSLGQISISQRKSIENILK